MNGLAVRSTDNTCKESTVRASTLFLGRIGGANIRPFPFPFWSSNPDRDCFIFVNWLADQGRRNTRRMSEKNPLDEQNVNEVEREGSGSIRIS